MGSARHGKKWKAEKRRDEKKQEKDEDKIYQISADGGRYESVRTV